MLSKIKFLIFVLILSLPVLSFAQSGKIVGKVIDLETGEPLIGANIIVQGTSLGAATDVSGDFIILSVPPGSYSVKARFIGYREQSITNLKVSVNLTTEANFSLPTEEFATDEVIVIAEKPLVNKNITNSTSVVSREDIENLPVRGVNAIVSTQAGVVSQGANLYIRGSRSDGVAYIVDGVLVNNPVFGGSQSGVISNAIEEIQVQAGGYSAEFGGANGGIVSTQTRSGTEKYNFSFEGITDNFAKTGEEFLGGYSYGYSELVFTAGGPVLPSYKKLKFFVAGSNTYRRSPANYYKGLDYKNVFDPTLGAAADTFDIFYPAGNLANSRRNQYQIQGNLTWDLGTFKIRLNGNLIRTDRTNGVDVFSYAGKESAGIGEDQTVSSSVKITHVLSNKSFYDVIVNYFDDYYVDMDPYFKHDITMYGDSIANDALGRNLRGDSQTPLDDQAYTWRFDSEDEYQQTYRKQKTQSVGGKINFLFQLDKHHEFKTGADFSRYTIRRYSLDPFSISNLAKSVADGAATDIYSRLDNYGYDVFGNELDNGINGPKNPVFAAYYIQDKMEFPDLVLNVGFRLDYIDIDGDVFKDASNVQFLPNGQIDPAGLTEVDPLLQVSPRIGISFPVTDKTVFHAQYGKFVQQSRLRDVYQGYNLIADNIKGGFAISAPVGFGLRPERTTSYEIGFRQQLGESFAFDITGFYKDIKDQVQIRSIFASEGAAHRQYYAWVNGDFATTKGFEMKLDLRRTSRISAQINYTYSDAQGTGSNPSSAFRSIWTSPTATPFFPQQIAPLDFNQAHTGFINLDYRWGDDDGGQVLQNLGMNLLFSFSSGTNYTRWEGFGNTRIPQEALNSSSTPWTFKLDLRVDKSFDVGPLDFNVYLWVINLLDTKNIIDVFNNSGDAEDDGWLSSPEGAAQTEGYRAAGGDAAAQRYQDLYRDLSYASGNFGTPRQIRVGLRLSY